LGPKETLVPDSLYTRITEQDYQAWLDLISQSKVQMEELLRRRARYEQSGRASLKSPGHPANAWARIKRHPANVARMKRREAAAQKKEPAPAVPKRPRKLQAAE
jgi:hypothetical protein